MHRSKRVYSVGDEPVPGYHLVRRLGKGQFGEVWHTSAPGGLDVALKIIDLEDGKGFREFESLQRIKGIHHPNLVPLFAFWLKTRDGEVLDRVPADVIAEERAAAKTTSPPRRPSVPLHRLPVELIIAMGLGSKSLFDRLQECHAAGKPGIPCDELLRYVREAAEAIDYLNRPLHDLGQGPCPIIHGDIKPHNLLVVGDSIQVCDFGLARAVENLRKTSAMMGTIAYAAPELLDGYPHAHSDQYCLAVTYVELRTGELPFQETNPVKVAELHRTGKLDLSRLPRAERRVIQVATSPDPNHRWPCCCQMVRAIADACVSEGEQIARPATATVPIGGVKAAPLVGKGDTSQTDREHQLTAAFEPAAPSGRGKGRLRLWSLFALAGLVLIGSLVWLAGRRAIAPDESSHLTNWKKGVDFAARLAREEFGPLAEELKKAASTGELTPNDYQAASMEIRGAWKNRFEQMLREPGLADAFAIWKRRPGELFPLDERDDFQRRLSARWKEEFERLLVGRPPDFKGAMQLIERTPDGLFQKAEIDRHTERARLALLAALESPLATDEARRLFDLLISKFPATEEARLARAKRQVEGRDFEGARNTLKQASAPPAKLARLSWALRLIVDSEGKDTISLLDTLASKKEDWNSWLKDFVKYYPPPKEKTPWFGEEEERQVTEIRLATCEHILQRLREPKPNFPAPSELLDGLEGLAPEPNIQARGWRTVVQLLDLDPAAGDPRPPLEAIAKLVQDAGGRWPFDYECTKQLAKAMQRRLEPGRKPPVPELVSELELIHKAQMVFGRMEELEQAESGIWCKRVALRVVEDSPPSEQEFEKLPDKLSAGDPAEQGLVEVWRAECMAVLGKPVHDLVPQQLPNVPTKREPYRSYVACLVESKQSRPQWNWIAGELATLAKKSLADEAMQVQNRLAKAVSLAVEATKELQIPTVIQLNKPLFASPFRPETELSSLYAVLSEGKEKNPRWSRAFALVSFYRNPPDLARAGDLARQLVTEKEGGSREDAILLYIYLASQAEKPRAPGDAADRLTACRRLLGLLGESKVELDPKNADLIWKKILGPAVAVADAERTVKPAALDRSALEDFYDAAGKFLADHTQDKWPCAAAKELAAISTAAIELHPPPPPQGIDPRLASYYYRRGIAQAKMAGTNHDQVLADADQAAIWDPKLRDAHRVRVHGYLLRSRLQPTRKQRLDDLDAAIAAGKEAVKDAKPESPELADSWLILSAAYVEKAGLVRCLQPEEQKQLEGLLEKSRDCALNIDVEHYPYRDYPYLALGIAYEDLAWMAEKEPEANYLRAVKAFQASRASGLPRVEERAATNLARCWYRAIAEGGVDPVTLGFQSESQAVGQCIELLQKVVADDPHNVEACSHLGQMHSYLGQSLRESDQASKHWEAADKFYTMAKDIAPQEQKLLYLATWARFPMSNGSRPRELAAKGSRERAEKMQGTPSPPGGFMETAKEIAAIEGDTWSVTSDYEKALACYSRELKDLPHAAPSDVNLLIGRARLRIAQSQKPGTKEEEKQVLAEGAVEDAKTALELSVGRAQTGYATACAASAHVAANPKIENNEHLDLAVARFKQAIDLLPRCSASREWRVALAKKHLAKAGHLAGDWKEKDPSRSLKESKDGCDLAIKLYDEAIDMTPEGELKKGWGYEKSEIEKKRKQVVDAQAAIAANAPPQPPQPPQPPKP